MIIYDTMQGIGEMIRRTRTLRGLTQEQLAFEVGLTRTSITNLEVGRQNIPVATLIRIAERLEVSLPDLVGEPKHRVSPLPPDVPNIERPKGRRWGGRPLKLRLTLDGKTILSVKDIEQLIFEGEFDKESEK